MSRARSAVDRRAMNHRHREECDDLNAAAWYPRRQESADRGMAARCLTIALLLIAAIAMLPFGASGADIPTAPILRIETGMHGASLNGIAVDQAHQQLVTVSDDKTVRSWSIADGQPVAIARGPIGP